MVTVIDKLTKKFSSLFSSKGNNLLRPASMLANNEFEFDFFNSHQKKKNDTEEVKNNKLYPPLSQFLQESYDKINGNEISTRGNQKIKDAKANYPFLNTPHQLGNESHPIMPWLAHNNNDILSDVSDNFLKYFHNTDSEFNAPRSKNFFSLPLKKIYDLGVNSFNNIKNTISILFSKTTEAFNFVNNIFNQIENFKDISCEKLAELIDTADKKDTLNIISKIPYTKLFEAQKELLYIQNTKLIETIITTPKNELDELFNKISHEKLAELINTKGLIADKNLEKIVDVIPTEKLAKIINSVSNENLGRIIDNISDQNLQKVMQEVSIEKTISILTLIHGEEYIEQLKTQQEEYNFENNSSDIGLLGNNKKIDYDYDSDIDSGFGSDFENIEYIDA